MTFLGVDVHQDNYVICLLNEQLNSLVIKALDLKNLVLFVKQHQPKYIGIDAPNGLNKGYMDDEHYREQLNLNSKYHYNKKVSEYYLSKMGFRLYNTPKTLEGLGRFKQWMTAGFKLFDQLNAIGYPSINENNINQISNGVVEVFPHASFGILKGAIVPSKNTDHGLALRKEIVLNCGINNLNNVYNGSKKKKSDILDATIAAYTVYKLTTDDYRLIGETDENQLLLPKKNLKSKYKRLSKSNA